MHIPSASAGHERGLNLAFSLKMLRCRNYGVKKSKYLLMQLSMLGPPPQCSRGIQGIGWGLQINSAPGVGILKMLFCVSLLFLCKLGCMHPAVGI